MLECLHFFPTVGSLYNDEQARNQGCAGGKPLPRKIFAPLEKCVGHCLELLDIVQNFWDPPRKLFTRPVVPSWLWA